MKRNKRTRIRVVLLGLSLAAWLCAAPAAAQTWLELFPTGGPSAPILGYTGGAGFYDVASNRLIVYFATNPIVGDPPVEVWVLSNANGLGGPPAWTQLFPLGSPPFIHGHTGIAYDELTNQLIVYGGCFAFCSPALANVHVLSNANGLGGPPVWTESFVTNPQPRVDHSVVLDAVNNTLIAFGGHFAFYGTDQNDSRLFSNANGLVSPSTWTPLGTSGALPGIRDDHSAIYDGASNRMTIFAGTNLISTCCPYVQSDYNDVWVLTNANGQTGVPVWMQMFPGGGPPPVRSVHSAVYDSVNNRMIVFGGLQWVQAAQSGIVLGDLWELSHANGLGGPPAWTQLAPSGTPPGPNYLHATAFDSASQRMIVFGGSDVNHASSNRVWVLVLVQTVAEQIQGVVGDLQDIIGNNPGTPLADKVEDAKAKARVALAELNKTPPDNQAAVGNIEGAVGDLEAAVKDGLLDPTQGTQLMDQFAAIARQFAVDALNQAIAQGGDPTKISEAQQALADGDALKASGTFKDAVNKYKDALAKAESALA